MKRIVQIPNTNVGLNAQIIHQNPHSHALKISQYARNKLNDNLHVANEIKHDNSGRITK